MIDVQFDRQFTESRPNVPDLVHEGAVLFGRLFLASQSLVQVTHYQLVQRYPCAL